MTLTLDAGNVQIKVTPDLHVMEDQKEKIIKLEFGKDRPEPNTIKIISQVMYESANHNGMALSSAAVLYYDVPRGVIHRGARAGARMRGNVEAACKTIEDIWHAI